MSRRSVVLVTIDSLRADHCGFMGYNRETTPKLDELAKNGLVFDNAIAPGTRTPESLPVMHTGQYPVSRGPISDMSDMQRLIGTHMDVRETLAERFSRRGYATAAFSPNPWTSRHFGFDAGFDYFVDFLDEDHGSRFFERILEGKGSKQITAIRLLLSWIQRENTFKPWESFYDRVIDWVRQQERPFFLWLFLLDPHFPYLSNTTTRSQSVWANLHSNLQLYLQSQTSPYSEKTHNRLVRGYDDAIRYTDKCIERLHTDIGDAADIIVTADHGEGFGEHGAYGHHRQLYEENIHVPLVVVGEDWEGTTEAPVSLASLPDIVGSVATGDKTAVHGVNRTTVPISPNKSPAGLRGRTWKYIRNDDSEELYNLQTDPGEQENCIEKINDQAVFRDALAKSQRHIDIEKHLVEVTTEAVTANGDSL